MREDYGTLPMSIHEDGFGDMGFDADTPDLARDLQHDPNIDESLFAEELEPMHSSKEPMPGTSRSMLHSLDHHHMDDDGFGDEFGRKLFIFAIIIIFIYYYFLCLLKLIKTIG